MKRCYDCLKTKPLSDFYKSNNKKDGRENLCAVCKVARSRAWIKENPERHKLSKKKNRLKNVGFTVEYFDTKFAEQNGVCAICGLPQKGKELAADHDHSSGTPRGLLCARCNLLIGMANDDLGILESAIAYLKHYKGDSPIKWPFPTET